MVSRSVEGVHRARWTPGRNRPADR